MKIQIDTTNKTIRIEEQVNLDDFIKMVKKIFPDNEWKEYKLEQAVINWNYPTWIYPAYPSPFTVYLGDMGDTTTIGADYKIPDMVTDTVVAGTPDVANGVYNVEFLN